MSSPEADNSTLPAGHRFAGRYEVQRQLGIGAMGTVYLVKDLLDGTERALKILHSDLRSEETLSKRFLREAELMKQVDHPNVVRTFDVGEEEGLLYFTMEVVFARPLDELIKHDEFGLDRVPNLILMMSSAIEAVHALGIIHRDLKPANILVLDDGSIKITDFGIARPSNSNLTGRQEILGTPQYMAPELIQGHEVTSSVDLYSFGIILYEAATGVVPFVHDQIPQLMWMHVRRAPTPPRDLNPDIPGWMNDLILKLLAKTPEERPCGISEVLVIARRHAKGALSAEIPDAAAPTRPILQARPVDLSSRATIPGGMRRRRRSRVGPVVITAIMMVAAVVIIFKFL